MSMHNNYLQIIESYLSDLDVTDRSKILTEILYEVQKQDASMLRPALDYVNEKRSQYGLAVYRPRKRFPILASLFKFSALMFIIFLGFLSFLIWKFTPVIKIDEESHRIVILGGLIDIDGKAGKLKLGDEYHYSHEGFSNDFQASINLNESQDEVLINFVSGSFNLKTSEDENFVLDCKLASPPSTEIISQENELIKINFNKIDGLNCSLHIPVDKRLTIEGSNASIVVPTPEYNLYVELENGKVYLSPEEEIDYNYGLHIENTDNSFIGDFESSNDENAYEIRIHLHSGAIIKK